MQFGNLVQLNNEKPRLGIEMKLVDFQLECEAIIHGVKYYKRVPLPMGQLQLVSNKDFTCTTDVQIEIKNALWGMINEPQTRNTITRTEQSLRDVIEAGIARREVCIENYLHFTFPAQPEYFTQ